MNIERLIIIDPGFLRIQSHHYEYNKALYHASSQKGINIRIYGNVNLNVADLDYPVKNIFKSSYYCKPLRNIISIFGYPLFFIKSNWCFYRELAKYFFRNDLCDTCFYLPTVDHNLFLGLLLWCFLIPGPRRPKSIVTLWMYSYERFAEHRIFKYSKTIPKIAFKLLDMLFPRGKIFKIATETNSLKSIYSKYTNHQVMAVPIPLVRTHYESNMTSYTNNNHLFNKHDEEVYCSYLGPVRYEKGFHLLLPAINVLKKLIDTKYLKFWLQTVPSNYEKEIDLRDKIIREFRRSSFGFVKLYEYPLTSEEYNYVLHKSDIILLPYLKEEYIHRGSGIFLEAISAGKFVVVPDQTWMSEKISEGINGVIFESGNSESLAKAIEDAYYLYKENIPKRQHIAEEIRKYHNSENLVELISDK